MRPENGISKRDKIKAILDKLKRIVSDINRLIIRNLLALYPLQKASANDTPTIPK
jgi:hypothetical protein